MSARVSARNMKVLILSAIIVLCVPALAAAADESVLGPGDVIRITVFGHPDLSTVVRINEDGMVSFPLIGDVPIGGLSTAKAESDVAKRLQRGGFVREAQVSIFVEQARQTLENSVLALGYVTKPGKYPLQSVSVDGVQSLADLLAVAGGTAPNAADYLMLIRRQGANVNAIKIDLLSLLNTQFF